MSVRCFITAVAAAAVSTVMISTAVEAQEARIVYHGNELTTDAGHQAVVTRIERAAQRACGYGTSLSEIAANRKCARMLSSQMVAQLGSPVLAATSDSIDGRKVASR